MVNNISQKKDDDEIDLNAIFGVIYDKKIFIIIVTSVFFVISVLYSVLATPIYRATALVQVEQKVPDLPGLSDLTQVLGTSSSEAVTEIAIITSRLVMGKAVSALNLQLQATPKYFPIIGRPFANFFEKKYPGSIAGAPWGLRSFAWGGEKIQLDKLNVPDDLLGIELKLVAQGAGNYALYDSDDNLLLKGMQGVEANGSGVDILVKNITANAGVVFGITKLSEFRAIEALQDSVKAEEQGKESGIIALRYNDGDPQRAEDVLDQVANAYVQQNISRNAAEAENSLEFVRAKLPEIRADLDKAQSLLSAYQLKSGAVDIEDQTKGLLEQEVSIDSNIEQLKLQQADVEKKFNPAYPGYQALKDQIAQLQAKQADFTRNEKNLPDTQKELLRLTRDVEVGTRTYTNLLSQAQQLDVARAGTVGNARIIDHAAVDFRRPYWPKKAIIVAAATVFGCFFAIGLTFIRQLLHRGIEDPSVFDALGLPIFSIIPLSKEQRQLELRGFRQSAQNKYQLLALENPADLAVEALRNLRTSLHFSQLQAKNNILTISASSPGVGKSFVATNLAVVMAQSGKKVLLIDADMRKGVIHRAFGQDANNGLSEVLSGTLSIDKAIKQVESLDSLNFITRGITPGNPSELLMRSDFSDILGKMSPQYDLIIIDTPPILAVTDASVTAYYSGTTLIVARFAMTQEREINMACRRFSQNGIHVNGVIFNAIEKRSDGYYSYGYYDYSVD